MNESVMIHPPHERVFEARWARIVSDVFSPPVIWALLAFPIALRDSGDGSKAMLWAVLYGALVCWIPVLYVLWNVKRGRITDMHIRVRSQRIRPFIVSVGCTTAAVGALALAGAPRLMPMFALFSLIQLIIMTGITFVWQISMHAMGISGAVVAAGALFGAPMALLLSPLVVLVGAARITLKRHTLAQIIGGTIVGGMMTALLFILC